MNFETTFWQDFSIADVFGTSAIEDTYQRAVEDWQNNVDFFKELVVVLNWKCWDYYEKGNEKYSKLYSKLYHKAHNIALKKFKGNDLRTYLSFVD